MKLYMFKSGKSLSMIWGHFVTPTNLDLFRKLDGCFNEILPHGTSSGSPCDFFRIKKSRQGTARIPIPPKKQPKRSTVGDGIYVFSGIWYYHECTAIKKIYLTVISRALPGFLATPFSPSISIQTSQTVAVTRDLKGFHNSGGIVGSSTQVFGEF